MDKAWLLLPNINQIGTQSLSKLYPLFSLFFNFLWRKIQEFDALEKRANGQEEVKNKNKAIKKDNKGGYFILSSANKNPDR